MGSWQLIAEFNEFFPTSLFDVYPIIIILSISKNVTIAPREAITPPIFPFSVAVIAAAVVLGITVMAQVSSPPSPFSAGLKKEFPIGLEPNAGGCRVVTAVLVVIVLIGEECIATPKLRLLCLLVGGTTMVAGGYGAGSFLSVGVVA
jgi:hypothetical protein